MMKNDPLSALVAAYLQAGNRVTTARTRKAIGYKTFGRKGAAAHSGTKQITLRDSMGFSRA